MYHIAGLVNGEWVYFHSAPTESQARQVVEAAAGVGIEAVYWGW